MSVQFKDIGSRFQSWSIIQKAGILLAAGLIVLPVANPKPTQLLGLSKLFYLVMFAITWDFASGYIGEFNFGHTVFIGIGAYTTAVLNISYGVSPFLSISLGVVLAGVSGLLLAIPTLRLKGAYFTLISLTAPLILVQIFVYFDEIFKGKKGFAQSPAPIVGTADNSIVQVTSLNSVFLADYYISLTILFIILGICLLITRSPVGSIFLAIKENQDAVAATGKNVLKFKVYAFTMSALMAGFAGAMFVHSQVGHPQTAQVLSIILLINIVLMVMVGGQGTIVGGVIGAILFTATEVAATTVSEAGIMIPIANVTPNDLMPVPLYVLGVIVIYFMPQGVYPFVRDRLIVSTRDRESESLEVYSSKIKRQIQSIKK